MRPFQMLLILALLAGCGGDSDAGGDDSRSWPVAWSAVLWVDGEDYEIEETASTITIWPDGHAAFDLRAEELGLVIELDEGLVAGRHLLFQGVPGPLGANLSLDGCDGDDMAANGYLEIVGLEVDDVVSFAFQFEADGCQVGIGEGRIVAP